MLALLALLQAAAAPPPAGVDGSPLAPIGRQALPATGCAAFLWSGGADRQLVAMAGASAGVLHLQLDGRPTDLPLADAQGPASYGFAPVTRYRLGGTVATLAMTVTPRHDLSQGAGVPEATLTLERAGSDGVAMPLVGIVGCAPGAGA